MRASPPSQRGRAIAAWRAIESGWETSPVRRSAQTDRNPCRHLDFRAGTLYVANSMQLTFFSYRFAAEVLDSPEFIDKRNDIIQIFTNLKVPQLPKPKQRPRAPGMTFTTDQKALNVALNDRFKEKEWECQPFVTNDRVTKIKADFADESTTNGAP